MIYIFLAKGFEDCEVVIPRDMLIRAEFDVKLVSIYDNVNVKSCMDLEIKADICINDFDIDSCIDNIQAIILPGGMPGTKNLGKDERLNSILMKTQSKVLIAAICAAPSILGKLGLLNNKKACCFPGCEKFLTGATIINERVVTDDFFITAKGPSQAFDFAFEIIRHISKSEEKVVKLKKDISYD